MKVEDVEDADPPQNMQGASTNVPVNQPTPGKLSCNLMFLLLVIQTLCF